MNDPDLTLTDKIRSMRSFDDYLALGYTRGIMRFDGETFSIINVGANVLYINKTKDGKILFDQTKGLFVIDDDFTTFTEIPTEKGITGNRLKFLVDGDNLYYTLNSRLFRTNPDDGSGVSEEIAIPYIKGSIVELAKIPYSGIDGKTKYKYLIGSQTQLYITDSLEVSRLTNYDFFDSTNGLQPIIANTSGYYDESEENYYLQSTNGIYVYGLNMTRGRVSRLGIAYPVWALIFLFSDSGRTTAIQPITSWTGSTRITRAIRKITGAYIIQTSPAEAMISIFM